MTRGIDGAFRPGWPGALCAAILLAACTRDAPPAQHPVLPAEDPAADAGWLAPLETEPSADSRAEAGAPSGARMAELEKDLAAALTRAQQVEASLAELRAQLAASEQKRVAREREWLEYSKLLGMVSPERLPGGKPFEAELPEESAPAETSAAPPAPIDPTLQARSLEIARALSTLFTLEQVRSMDLLECGTLEGNAIGPVVFRLLDGRGRLSGSLYAERLRMEASRSARTLTLVLEDGYEMRAGKALPFEKDASDAKLASARRIVLEGIDPLLWADEFLELFGERGLDLSGDDGRWDLVLVKQQLNLQLRTVTAGGTYRLRELGGVQAESLIGVHLERSDESGRLERRFFADRLRIARAAGGIEIVLENGVQVRGEDERVPFLDGRYRILLPSADGEAWARAGLPGLSLAPPTSVQRKPAGADLR